MDTFDLDFYELSDIADDPQKLEQLKNHYYDPDFDEWVEDFDKEQVEKQRKKEIEEEERQYKASKQQKLDMPDQETIEYTQHSQDTSKVQNLPTEDYEMSIGTDSNEEWERDDE